MKKTAKILGRTLGVLLLLVLILAGLVFGLWHHEIRTLLSIEMLQDRNDAHLDGAVYTMEVSGGFYLDDFVARGGVTGDGALIQFITDHLTKGLIPLKLESPEIGCSSFTARTEEGDVLFGRNYDFSKTNTVIVKTEASEGRHSTISTVDLQFLSLDPEKNIGGLMEKAMMLAAPYAPLDGINDAGVSCGIYMTYQGGETTVATDQNTAKPDFTSTTLLRLILDYADSLEEAVEIASSYDLHDSAGTSYHYMVADATGRSAVLEWVGSTDDTDNDGSDRQLVVTYSDQDAHIGEKEAESDFQVVTNFILKPGYYDGSPEENKKGLDRYNRLWADVSAVQGIFPHEEAAMELLKTVGRRSWNNDDKNGCTVHSVIYNLTDRTVLWIPNEHFEAPGYRFSFQ